LSTTVRKKVEKNYRNDRTRAAGGGTILKRTQIPHAGYFSGRKTGRPVAVQNSSGIRPSGAMPLPAPAPVVGSWESSEYCNAADNIDRYEFNPRHTWLQYFVYEKRGAGLLPKHSLNMMGLEAESRHEGAGNGKWPAPAESWQRGYASGVYGYFLALFGRGRGHALVSP
jgi:hypothetical protein